MCIRDSLEWLRSPHPEFVEARPWNAVINLTRFGLSTGPRAHWWWQQVQAPLSARTGSPAGHTVAEFASAHAGGSSGKTGSTKRKQPNQPRAAPAAKAKSRDSSGEVCFAFNDGTCRSPCPQGRRHVCKACSGSHRSFECPTASGADSSAQKGGGGGGKKRGGKGKKGGKGK